jgi:hypothetical protein
VPLFATICPPPQPEASPTSPLDASCRYVTLLSELGLGPEASGAPPDNVLSEEHVASWFSNSRSRSSQYIAESTCEMICYLWFSQSSNLSPVNTSPSHPYIPLTARPQFTDPSVFVHFMQKLLQTAQLSQSDIVLSLHFVYRLKERNSGIIAHRERVSCRRRRPHDGERVCG